MKKIFKNMYFYDLLIIIALILFACYYFYDRNDTVTLKIGNEEYTFKKNETEKNIDLITFNSENDLIIKSIKNSEKIKINDKKILFSKNLGKIKLNKNTEIKISIKYKNDKEYTDYIINTVPSDFPEYETTGKSMSDGDFYLSTYGGLNVNSYDYIFKINNDGDLLFYRRVFKGTYVFKKENIDNKTYYSYIDYEKDSDIPSLHILDENYNLIKIVYNKNEMGEKISINPHDYIVKDLNDFIFLSGNDSNDEGESDFVISELKNDKIVFKYTSDDYEKQFQKEKSYHFNSFYLDGDNLLVSFRNTSEILNIDIKTGDLLWVLNGNNNYFDKNIFKYQHSISKYDNKYIVYNNNANEKYDNNLRSSIVIFELDLENFNIINEEEYEIPLLSVVMGSVFKTKDTFVLAYGTHFFGDDVSNFDEIDCETGEYVFKFKYSNNYGKTYRVYKF